MPPASSPTQEASAAAADGSRSSPSATTRALIASGVAAVAAVQLLPWLTWSVDSLTAHALFRDDGFFYAVLAENFARFGVLSFDGELATNGVQPLWMAILLLAKAVFPDVHAATLLARLSFFSYVGFAFLGAWWASRGARTATTTTVSVAIFSGGLLLNPAFQHFAVRGLETPLLLLLLIAFLQRVDSLADREGCSALDAASLALLGAACFFARTHLFWLSVVAFAWIAWRWRGSFAPLASYAAVTTVLVAPYLAFNALSFGSAMPISGRVKRFYLDLVHPTLGDYLDSHEWHGLFSAFAESVWVGFQPNMALWAVAVLLVLLPLLVLSIRALQSSPAALRLPASLSLLALASCANGLLMYGWYRELRPYTSYYFAAEVVFVVAAAAWLLAAAVPRPRTVVAGCAVLLLAASIGRFAGFGPSDYWATHLAVVEDVKALPADATVGAYWPGALGALAGRAILPLDGIIASPAYFDEWVRTQRDLDWLLARRSPHLAIYLHSSPETLLESVEPPPLPRWNRLGELRLWSRRDCGPRVLARHPRRENGTGWYLFAFDPAALERCRRTHEIERYPST